MIVLSINLGTLEYYNGEMNEFMYEDGGVVRFEYSLKAVYDWEGIHKTPFLNGDLNEEQIIDFYSLMALDPFDTKFLTSTVIHELTEYISNSHTATTFSEEETKNTKAKAKVHTAEQLYALMIQANVPLDFENRNLNRLLDILRIISAYNSPPKKMSRQDIYKQNADLNAKRKAEMKSKG